MNPSNGHIGAFDGSTEIRTSELWTKTVAFEIPLLDAVIQAEGLTRRFGDLTAVDGLDLEVHRGEVFGFLGPNGSGKSTTIRMLVGLLAPSAGRARVLGREIPGDAEELRTRVGYMTQKFSLYSDLSVAENLEFAAEIFGLDRQRQRQRIEAVIEEYSLGDRRGQRPATLSGGWKQRLALAVATVHEPELLFLDEPTAGVDPDSRRLFWEKLFKLAATGTTILVSTHYMDEAVRCHRICVVRDGKRAALGRPAEFTRALEGRVVEIWGEPTNVLMEALRRRGDVASAAQLGSRVHVLLAPDAPPAEEAMQRIVGYIKAEGLERPGGAIARPNLEDALVALTKGERLEVSGRTL